MTYREIRIRLLFYQQYYFLEKWKSFFFSYPSKYTKCTANKNWCFSAAKYSCKRENESNVLLYRFNKKIHFCFFFLFCCWKEWLYQQPKQQLLYVYHNSFGVLLYFATFRLFYLFENRKINGFSPQRQKLQQKLLIWSWLLPIDSI